MFYVLRVVASLPGSYAKLDQGGGNEMIPGQTLSSPNFYILANKCERYVRAQPRPMSLHPRFVSKPTPSRRNLEPNIFSCLLFRQIHICLE